MAYIYDLVDTWNNGATTFTAVKMNVTDTASNAASLLMDLQVGGSSQFNITKQGIIRFASTIGLGSSGSGSVDFYSAGTGATNSLLRITNGSTSQRSDGTFGWSATTTVGTNDTILSRRAAANLRLGAADAAAPVAQTLSVQSVVAGTSNTAGANLTITGSQGTGTGAGGSIIFQVAPAGSTGSAQNGLSDALTIASNRSVTLAAGSATLKRGSTANYLIYENAGLDVFQVTGGEINLVGNALLTWGTTSNTFTGYTADTILRRDAANTLALRNGTAAQTFRVYNTYDGTNDERGFIKWASNIFQIGTDKTGTGTARALEFQTDGTTRLTIASTGLVTVNGGNLVLGETGVLRTRYINNGNNSLSMFDFVADATGTATFAVGGSAPLMRFGGTSASFPAIKRSTTFLQVRLADDTAFAGFASANMQAATAYTVATLPGTPGTGMIARVTDALAPTIGMTVAAGGAAYALVNYNGANWTVIGV
jgi:hypothetical protein